MCEVCSTHVTEDINVHKIFAGKFQRKKTTGKPRRVEEDGGVWTGLICIRIESSEDGLLWIL
jgi:hypothetical protein